VKRPAVLLAPIYLLLVACSVIPTSKVEVTVVVTAQVAQQTETSTPNPTAAATLLPAPTPTQAAAPTDTPELTVASAVAPTNTPPPSPFTATVVPTTTPLPPPEPTVVASPVNCSVLPTGSFLTIWQSNPDLQTSLGCPTSYHPRITPTAWEVKTSYQPFERGEMIWSDHIGWYEQPVVYVIYADSTYQRLEDTFDPATDPTGGGETPPNGLVEPKLGFGKVWHNQPGVREALGWATTSEAPGEGRFQTFFGGDMVWISQTNKTYVFVSSDNTVYTFDIPFSED
jgi:hypothetical protein